MGSKIVIMEVVEVPVEVPEYAVWQKEVGIKSYKPVDRHNICGPTEMMYLAPSRIIDSDRLRYGHPLKGETFFNNSWFWGPCLREGFQDSRLILDPAHDEKSAFEKWLDDCPLRSHRDYSSFYQTIGDWLRRMPPNDDI